MGMSTKPYFAKIIEDKLMLCSRAVKVGDTLKECMPDGKEYTVHHFEAILPCGVLVMNPWPSENEVWIHTNKAFKVVGEISNEAKWIREGDEFEENEVHRNHICYDTPGNMGCCFHCSRSKGCDSEDYNYLIKGVCGHFH